MTPDRSFVVDLASCARCGNVHANLRFFAFERDPIKIGGVVFTHWGLCPVLREPIVHAMVPKP